MRELNSEKPSAAVRKLIQEAYQAEPDPNDPAIDALWERVNAGDGYGPDIEGGAEEVALMKFAAFGRSVGFRIVLGISMAQWRKEQAEKLLDCCIEKGWSNVLPDVLALGESLDLHGSLMQAARSGRPECAKLLASRCDANQLDESTDKTPLMAAAAQSNAKTVQALLPFSDIFAKTKSGKTIFNTFLGEALPVSTHPDSEEIVDMLDGIKRSDASSPFDVSIASSILRMVDAEKTIEKLLRSARERHLIEDSLGAEAESVPRRRSKSL